MNGQDRAKAIAELLQGAPDVLDALVRSAPPQRRGVRSWGFDRWLLLLSLLTMGAGQVFDFGTWVEQLRGGGENHDARLNALEQWQQHAVDSYLDRRTYERDRQELNQRLQAIDEMKTRVDQMYGVLMGLPARGRPGG